MNLLINKELDELRLKIINDDYINKNTKHLKIGLNFLEDHNLSLSIYHLQMYLENNPNDAKEIQLKIIHIFCSIGLVRMVDRLSSEIPNSGYNDFIKGLNYFNKKELTLSQIHLEKALEEKINNSEIVNRQLPKNVLTRRQKQICQKFSKLTFDSLLIN